MRSDAMNALVIQVPDQSLHYAVILRPVLRDEVLPKLITSHQACVVANGKD
jgi:hypothetical protein